MAVSEKDERFHDPEVEAFVRRLFSDEEIFEVAQASEEQRAKFFEPVFEAALEPPIRELETVDGRPVEEDLPVVSLPEVRELNENEEKRLRKKEDALLRELRIFLRFVQALAFFTVYPQPHKVTASDYHNY